MAKEKNPADVKAFTARQVMEFIDTIIGGNTFEVPSGYDDNGIVTADVIERRIKERVEYLRKRFGC